MKRIKSEKGAITIIVLVSMLFFVAFLVSTYVVVANKVQSQKEAIEETKRIYEPKQTMAEVYNSYFNTDNIIPINSVEQLLAIGTGRQINIDGKIYTFSNTVDTVYLLKNDLLFRADDYQLTNGYWTPIGDNENLIAQFEGGNNTIEVIYLDNQNEEYSKIYSIQNNFSDSSYLTNIEGLDANVTLIAYKNLTSLNDTTSENEYLQELGTNLKAAADAGKVSAVLTETINGVENIAVIPSGFTVSTEDEEDSIREGLVLKDGANEYVWIPYTDNTVYVEDSFGPLTGTHKVSGTTYTYDTQAELTNYYGYKDANNTIPFFNISEFTYVQDKLDIEESINKYRGFYVGRYETTITDEGIIGSMPNENVLSAGSSTAQTNNKQCRWYGLYKVQKDLYAENEVVFSRMITSKEWNKILTFTNYGNTVRDKDTTYTTKPDKSGAAYKDSNPAVYDKTHNIYDLAGNLYELTLTMYSATAHTYRGGASGVNAKAEGLGSYPNQTTYTGNRQQTHTLYKVIVVAIGLYKMH